MDVELPDELLDLEAWYAAIEQNRVEMEKAWLRAENLEAAVADTKESCQKLKGPEFPGRSKP